MKKTININGELMDLSIPKVMGILNVTPDSFYSESRKQTEQQIVARCQQIINEGGTIIDVGAQSTTPTSRFIDAKEEAERLVPALKLIRQEFPNAIVSIDTFYADVATMAVEKYGVNMINDISGGQIDEEMFPTMAKLNVPYVLMHMREHRRPCRAHSLRPFLARGALLLLGTNCSLESPWSE